MPPPSARRGEQRADVRRGEQVARRFAHRGQRRDMARELFGDENLQPLGDRLHLLRFEPPK